MESLHCFFVFGWIKLKFGVGGNLEISGDFEYVITVAKCLNFAIL